MAPVFAFDREVIPAGALVSGHVSRVTPVAKSARARAILGGDFTPLRVAQVDFTSVQLAGGQQLALATIATPGLDSLFSSRHAKQRTPPPPDTSNGFLSNTKQTVKNQVNSRLDAIRSIPDMVHSPGKMEMVTDYLWSRLPYHPQYVRNRTRFDAELRESLDFGSQPTASESFSLVGSQPASASIVHARLVTPLDSKTSTPGETVQAVTTEPLFSDRHQLILPEGTRLEGKVVMVTKARWFHRGGRLRFTFQEVELSPESLALASAAHQDSAADNQERGQFRTQASLKGAEGSGGAIKVNDEGGVQAKESNTRFIGTALAVIVAQSAADSDRVRGPNGTLGGRSPNVGGRTLGGGMGFGLLGSAAAQSSRTVGTVFGYYGLAWSVFSTVVARGQEVQFDKNAMIDVGFNAREKVPAKTPKVPAAAK